MSFAAFSRDVVWEAQPMPPRVRITGCAWCGSSERRHDYCGVRRWFEVEEAHRLHAPFSAARPLVDYATCLPIPRAEFGTEIVG